MFNSFIARIFKAGALCLLVILVLFSCKKDTPSNITEPMPQICLDYGYFKVGTYWIYQDSASHVIDSVRVMYSEYGDSWITAGPPGGNSFNEHYYAFNTQAFSALQGMMYGYNCETRGATQFGGAWEIYLSKQLYPYVSSAAGEATVALFMDGYFVSGQPISPAYNSGYETVVFESNQDSMKVLNTYFKNVIFFQDGYNRTENNSITNTYTAKNIGIIRKEVPSSHKVWNLIRYCIIQ